MLSLKELLTKVSWFSFTNRHLQATITKKKDFAEEKVKTTLKVCLQIIFFFQLHCTLIPPHSRIKSIPLNLNLRPVVSTARVKSIDYDYA